MSLLGLVAHVQGGGRQERILPHCHSLIPGMINPHGLTNDAMILLDTMDLQNRRMVHSEVAQHHWRQEGKHHGRVGVAVGP